MRKFFFPTTVAILTGLISLHSPTQVFACSCIAPEPPKAALEKSRAVFAGKVTKIDANQLDKVAGSINISFDVSKSWKGIDTPTLTVETARDSASCGFAFEEGKEYLVYTDSENLGTATVSLCSRTALLSDAGEDVTALGAGKDIAPTAAEPEQPFLTEQGFMTITLGLMAAVVVIPTVVALASLLISKKKSS